VKVIFDTHGDALYFSRSPLPFVRNPEAWPRSYRHLGIYGFQRSFLFQFVAWPPSRWSRPSRWSSSAPSKTARASVSCSPTSFPPAWTRRSRPPPSNSICKNIPLELRTENREPRTIMKYIFVTGGVVSSLGKGLAASSLGTLLELRGLQGHHAEV
jgi:hypothetical protein